MMSRKIIILLILISITILYFLPEIYRTAFVVFYGSTEMNMTVIPIEHVYDIVIVCEQDVVDVGQSISANITITNNGGYEGDITIEWWIEDASGTNYTSSSTVVNISYGESWISTKSLLVPSTVSAGIYYYKVRVIAETYENTAYDTFEVQVPTATTIAAGPGAGVGMPEEVEKIANIEVVYKKYPIVVAGIPKEYEIMVKNTGDLVLHNLSLYLQGLELSWYSMEPNRVDLEINESVIFKIDFTVPASAEIKKYPVNIVIRSEELEKSIYLTLEVIEILGKTEFEELREQLEEEIREIEEELEELQERGIPIDPLYRLLYKAKEKIGLARSEMEVGNLPEASILINEAKFIIDVIKETIISIRPYQIRPLWMILLIIIILIIAIMVIRKIKSEEMKDRWSNLYDKWKSITLKP